MAKKKKTHTKSKVPRFDEVPVIQMPESGVRLEQLCEEREVGMDGVSHWKDAVFEETDIYNVMGWFEFDGSHLDLTSIIPDIKVIKLLPRSKFEPLQHFLKPMKVEEVHLAPGNFYYGTGTFRYEAPGDTRGVGDLNLMFDDIADIGISARIMQF
jgi:hypothetical protein